jgi:hypothetical protein
MKLLKSDKSQIAAKAVAVSGMDIWKLKFEKPIIRPHKFNSLEFVCAESRPGGRRKIKKGQNNFLNNLQKRFFYYWKSLLNHFIHFQLQNNAPICLQIPPKVKATLGKSCSFLPVILKYPMSEVLFFSPFSDTKKLPAHLLSKQFNWCGHRSWKI